jgi:hypothetical protein
MDNGYIKLFRSFREWYGYSSSKRVHLWIDLLMRANHAPADYIFNGHPIVINAGQFITGRKKLHESTGISESYIEDLLSELENQKQIQQVKCSTSRLITIVKWADFQSCDNGEDNRATTERQPSDTNKNNKNNKNDKNKNVGGTFLKDKKDTALTDLPLHIIKQIEAERIQCSTVK